MTIMRSTIDPRAMWHRPFALAMVCLVGCEVPAGVFRLADGFDISAKATMIGYMPLPWAESDHNYHFIGIGWLCHSETEDTWYLVHEGCPIAAAKKCGDGGWELVSDAARRRILDAGWVIAQHPSRTNQIIVGCTRASGPRSGGAVVERSEVARNSLASYWHKWETDLTPKLILDPSWDSVIFACDSDCEGYVRLVAFDSSHYQFIRLGVLPDRYAGDLIRFRLRDRYTGKEVRGQYRCTFFFRHDSKGPGPQVEILSGAK